MIDVKLLQEYKYCISPIERHHKNSPHSALFKSSRRYQNIVSYGLIISVFKFSDIKLSLVKMKKIFFYYLPYTPGKTKYNLKNASHLWCGVVCCGPGLAPVRPWLQGDWPCTEFMKAHKSREVWSQNLTTGQHIGVKFISEPSINDWTELDMLSLHLTDCKVCRWPSIYSQLVIGLLCFNKAQSMCRWCFGFGARSRASGVCQWSAYSRSVIAAKKFNWVLHWPSKTVYFSRVGTVGTWAGVRVIWDFQCVSMVTGLASVSGFSFHFRLLSLI